MTLRILNAEPLGYDPEARQILCRIGAVDDDRTLSNDELGQRIGDYDILLVRLGLVINDSILARTARLQIVVSPTTGTDHLDLQALHRRGVAALTLKGETHFLSTVSATAEHTWALLLALKRRIVEAATMGSSGQWNRDKVRGHELRGGNLGIVGYGRLGRMVARYGKAFDMKVRIYDPAIKEAPFPRLSSLSELVSQSDVVSLHVPLNDETHHLITADILSGFRDGSVLINTSRGSVIDSLALITALDEGHLAGAALDVVEDELTHPNLPLHPLLAYARAHENLIITPHIGGATCESMARAERFMALKLLSYCHSQGLVTT